jgi:hypothetical protein
MREVETAGSAILKGGELSVNARVTGRWILKQHVRVWAGFK